MNTGKTRLIAVVTVVLAVLFGMAKPAMAVANDRWLEKWQKENKSWRAMHLGTLSHNKFAAIKQFISEVLADRGFNVLIVEVNYSFRFTSHPELAGTGLDKEQARQLAEICRKHGIRLIPLFNCLGHQSWTKDGTFALLKKYPQFNEKPYVPQDSNDIYCREWCPSHPDINKIVFALIDELIDAFDADAFHVGMDEVFLIGDQKCPRCKGKDVAKLYAKVVNELYQHIVKEKGLEMLMWGDRLLDANEMPYSKWESSTTGSHKAIDFIPKNIIICDWHYSKLDDYPSVRFFQQKGFRVLPSTWINSNAAIALRDCAAKDATDKMLGMLFTGWSTGVEELLNVFRGRDDWPDKGQRIKRARQITATIKALTEQPGREAAKP